jgi:hypothetical protein
MDLGFQQLAVCLYVLLLVVSPRRMVGGVRRLQTFSARLRRRPAPVHKNRHVLRVFDLVRHSPTLGWALAVLGGGLCLLAYFTPALGLAEFLVLPLYVVGGVATISALAFV